MSVIAKLTVNSVSDFGSGSLVELSCVCNNDLMTEYAGSHEDKLFTRYSPWGEARLHLSKDSKLPIKGDQFYFMLLTPQESDITKTTDAGPIHKSALYSTAISVSGLTDRGEGVAKQVEFTAFNPKAPLPDQITNLNWKMSVDNPAATNQFKPAISGYTLGVYPASAFDRDQAIHAAHSQPT